MLPSQVSATLRHIASKIDSSERPDRALVSQDLRRLTAGLRPGEKHEGGMTVGQLKGALSAVGDDTQVGITVGFGEVLKATGVAMDWDHGVVVINHDRQAGSFEDNEADPLTFSSL